MEYLKRGHMVQWRFQWIPMMRGHNKMKTSVQNVGIHCRIVIGLVAHNTHNCLCGVTYYPFGQMRLRMDYVKFTCIATIRILLELLYKINLHWNDDKISGMFTKKIVWLMSCFLFFKSRQSIYGDLSQPFICCHQAQCYDFLIATVA